MDWSCIFHAAIVSFFEGQNVTYNGNVTNNDFLVIF